MQTITIEVKFEGGPPSLMTKDEVYCHVKSLLHKEDVSFYSIAIHTQGKEKPEIEWDCPEL
jgi:hypothetical protein